MLKTRGNYFTATLAGKLDSLQLREKLCEGDDLLPSMVQDTLWKCKLVCLVGDYVVDFFCSFRVNDNVAMLSNFEVSQLTVHKKWCAKFFSRSPLLFC